MKVIGINGSSRKDGNTAIIIRTIFEELNKRGIETEFIQLADVDIEPCRACFACKGKGNCVFRKDGFAEVFSKIVGADGIILGSPVYSADVSSRMKALLDRGGVVAAVNPGILKHKLGVAVAAVRRAGGMTAVDTMNHFFLNKEMIVLVPHTGTWFMGEKLAMFLKIMKELPICAISVRTWLQSCSN